ncbi:T9SS type A sorting domain-containing protein [Bacteroidota bacterium]
MKVSFTKIAFVLLLLISNLSFTQWTNDPSVNTPVCVWNDYQHSQQIISDHMGGAIIAWLDFRSGNADIFIQRISEGGYALWDDGGKAVITNAGNQFNHKIVKDGEGGCILTWEDDRNGNSDIYAQRIDSSGNLVWDSDGVVICNSPLDQEDPQIVTSGSGAIILWEFKQGAAGETGLYAQRINSTGQQMWGVNGVPVATSPFPDPIQLLPKITDDGSGGAVIAWTDFSGANDNIYAQRISNSGNVFWPQNGLPVSTTAVNKRFQDIINVGNGEFVVSWNSNISFDDWDLRAQKINTLGNILWNIDGLVICSSDVSFNPSAIAYDNNNSVIIAWEDRRANPPGTIYCQKLSLDGSIQWQQNGLSVSSTTGFQYQAGLVCDSNGNSIVCWQGGISSHDIFAQKFDGSGNRLWVPEGMGVCIASDNQSRHNIIITSDGDFIVSWDDERGTDSDIYAQSINALVTTVDNSTLNLPERFALEQNYPNPFNPSTTIKFIIPVTLSGVEGSLVTLKIYNAIGKEVATLANEEKPAGIYEVEWNATGLPSGVYLYRLQADSFVGTNKMILLK